MGKKRDEEQLLGQLPGTGGDFIDTNDVEGHRKYGGGPVPVAGEDVAKGDAPEPEDDVEGHLRMDHDDEPGLYRGGPTTQGEIVMRGPGDNPHGDR